MVSLLSGRVGALPRLVVPYDPGSFSPLQIVESVGDLCELIWVVDSAAVPLGPLGALLARLGTVVDLEGRPLGGSLGELARLGPSGIVTFSNSTLMLAAELAGELGLCFSDSEAVTRCVDKHAQRSALRDAGLPGPRFVELELGSDGRLLGEPPGELDFPAVLKPRSGTGSRETHYLADPEALAALLEVAEGAEPIAPGSYLLEEYLADPVDRGEGSARVAIADYVSVESVISAGAVRHLAVTGKFPLAEPFRETGNFMPSTLSPALASAVLELASQAIAAVGTRFGCLHTEIKLTPAGPRVIELNPRLGGGAISEIFELRSGTSLLRLAVLAALGLPLPPLELSGGVAFSLFLQPPTWARALKAVEGLDEAAALPGIRRVSLNRQPPCPVNWREGSQGYLSSVLGVARDHGEMVERRAELLELLRPVLS